MAARKGGLNRGFGAFIKDTQIKENISKTQEESKEDLKEDKVEKREETDLEYKKYQVELENLDDKIQDQVENKSIEDIQEGDRVVDIDLDRIRTNPDQPRKTFDQESLAELADSIREIGLIQPILLRVEEDNTYTIIAGERRYRAAQIVGLETIPSIVRDYDNLDRDRIALIENIQREDLNPYEEARAYKQILDNYGISQQELADQVGKSRPYVSNLVRLLNLDSRVLDLVREERISQSIARELLSIEDGDDQYRTALDVMSQGLSVSDLAKRKKPQKKKNTSKTSNKPKDIHVVELESNFEEVLGTKVSIDDRKKTIKIDYYDNDDLQRIIEIIIGE